jgi:hypothetical protein
MCYMLCPMSYVLCAVAMFYVLYTHITRPLFIFTYTIIYIYTNIYTFTLIHIYLYIYIYIYYHVYLTPLLLCARTALLPYLSSISIICGLSFYLYNEMQNRVLSSLGPVPTAVGNTLKRVVIFVALYFFTQVR